MNGMKPKILKILGSIKACLYLMVLKCFGIKQELYLRMNGSIMEKSVI